MAASPCPECSLPYDCLGDHFLSCRYSGLWSRHNHLRDTLYDLLVERGISVQKEVAIGGLERPADLYLPTWPGGKPVCVDITIVQGISDDVFNSNVEVITSTTEQAEHAKRVKYQHLFYQPSSAQRFMPVAFDVFGRPGPAARQFLHQLSRVCSANNSLQNVSLPPFNSTDSDIEDDEDLWDPSIISPCLKISVAIARQIGQQLLSGYNLACATYTDPMISPHVSPNERMEETMTNEGNSGVPFPPPNPFSKLHSPPEIQRGQLTSCIQPIDLQQIYEDDDIDSSNACLEQATKV